MLNSEMNILIVEAAPLDDLNKRSLDTREAKVRTSSSSTLSVVAESRCRFRPRDVWGCWTWGWVDVRCRKGPMPDTPTSRMRTAQNTRQPAEVGYREEGGASVENPGVPPIGGIGPPRQARMPTMIISRTDNIETSLLVLRSAVRDCQGLARPHARNRTAPEYSFTLSTIDVGAVSCSMAEVLRRL
jgi:hypothetical protein